MGLRWKLHRGGEPPHGIATAATLVCIYAGPAFLLSYFCRDASSTAPFYVCNGVIVAGLLVLSKRIGLLFCGACLIVNLIQNIFTHNDLAHNLLYALLNQAVSVGAAVMIRSLCGAASDLFRLRRLVVFAAITLVAAGLEALVGQAICILLEGSSADAFNKWLQWAAEDALGLLIATPAVLLPLKRRRVVYASDAGHLERWLLLGAVAAVGALAFAQSNSALALLIYPLLMLVACRAGPVWVSAAVLVNAFSPRR